MDTIDCAVNGLSYADARHIRWLSGEACVRFAKGENEAAARWLGCALRMLMKHLHQYGLVGDLPTDDDDYWQRFEVEELKNIESVGDPPIEVE